MRAGRRPTLVDVRAGFVVFRKFVAGMTVTVIRAFAILTMAVETNVVTLRAFVNINAQFGVMRRQLEAVLALELFFANKTVFVEREARWTRANRLHCWVAIMRAPAVHHGMTRVDCHARSHIFIKIHVLGTLAYYFFMMGSAGAVEWMAINSSIINIQLGNPLRAAAVVVVA